MNLFNYQYTADALISFHISTYVYWIFETGPASRYVLNPLLTTNTKGLSPSWEAVSCSARQEMSRILWNVQVYCHIHNYPPPALILSQINPVHAHPNSWGSSFTLSFHPRLCLLTDPFPSGFPIQTLYVPLLYSYTCSCSTHLRLDTITLIITHLILSRIILNSGFQPWCNFTNP